MSGPSTEEVSFYVLDIQFPLALNVNQAPVLASTCGFFSTRPLTKTNQQVIDYQVLTAFGFLSIATSCLFIIYDHRNSVYQGNVAAGLIYGAPMTPLGLRQPQ